MRASASVPPPGGKPTMMRIGAARQCLRAQVRQRQRGGGASGGLDQGASLHGVVS